MYHKLYLVLAKALFISILIVVLPSCKKEDGEVFKKPVGQVQLKEIRVDNQIRHSFIYHQTELAEERWFGFDCKNTPTDVFIYVYQQGKLTSLETTLRSLYSSTAALCDPNTGITTEESYEYDTQGRLHKTIRDNSYTIYDYTTSGLVAKQTLYSSSGTIISTTHFRHDARGNIIEEQDAQGNSTQYEYDDQPNPFYLIKQKPGWISAYNKSPNNVLKASGAVTFDRTIEYFPNGLPRRVLENGVYYTYHYE
ncbi:RHS repeat domain-containing protein [Rhodocytophaga aerolata]|uniref:RHS repeat domain-containing protein n=1 Tax=Rhodocytophaga aerolata TaxID=455078 RepID=A0ABT8R334_9BACT|nr:RHS repeat domain-containing protein [Rhodocytophaga aerolata]MDO1445603.1 RHS repeat domain-containing protein [Rhodocytophaga aerolata]